MKTAYLHIGTYRTASTALQMAIIGHRESLLAAGGVYVPQAGTNSWRAAHHRLAQELLDPSDDAIDDQPSWIALGEELQSAPDHRAIVLSSEDFSAEFPRVLPQISTFLRRRSYEAHFILALRNQVDCLNSEYCESIRSQKTSADIDYFIDEHAVDPRFNYWSHFIEPMRDIGASYSVLSYDLNRASIVDDALRVIGAPEFICGERGINSSITAESILLLKAASKPGMEPIKKLLSHRLHELERRFDFSLRYFGFDQDTVDRLFTRFNDGNVRLVSELRLPKNFFTSREELLGRPFTSEARTLAALRSWLSTWSEAS